MSKILNVLYQSDNNYAPIMGVSMTSLFENNKDIDEINVYILDDKISEGNLAKIMRLCEQYNRKLNILDTESIVEMLKELNVTTWHGGYSTWLKLFIVEKLALPTDSVLYIDCDTLIIGSLAPLCDFEFNGNVAAMTYDCMLNEYKKVIGIMLDEKYHNAGVILFNQKAWIENKCEEEVTAHIKNNRYFLNEQDVLNVLYRKRIMHLDCRYNFFSYYLLYGISGTLKIFELNEQNFLSAAEINEAAQSPVIHHMIGAPTGRPWEKNNRHPLNTLFDKYLELSPWHDFEKVINDRGLVFKIQGILYRILPRGLYIPIHKLAFKRYLRKMNALVQKA